MILLSLIMDPSAGYVIGEVGTYEAKPMPSIATTFLNMAPTNPINAAATDNILQIIVLALFMGIAIWLLGEKGKPALAFFDSVAEIMHKITAIVMGFAPKGVFALIAWATGASGADVLLPLAKLISVCYLATALHAVIVYFGAVYIWAKMRPTTFFKGIFEAMAVAFSSCSSSATLPAPWSLRHPKANWRQLREVVSHRDQSCPAHRAGTET